MDHSRAPFAEDLLASATQPRRSFHMPGHKQAGTLLPRLRGLWGEAVFRSDLAEMSGIDYLEAPAGSLATAQALAAEAFGADSTYFLVNGSTAGNQAAFLASARRGDKVIVPRASHRSVFAGLVLSGAEPVFVPATLHPETGLPLATPAPVVDAAIRANPGAAAVHLTSPSYYGCCSDVAAIAASVAAAAMPLLVDEAHGTHFVFHPRLPRGALQVGASLAVQSMHKTGGSLYQSSMLHLKRGHISPERVFHALGLLQSSSPSSLLLASLDEARSTLATQGKALLEHALELAESARARINGVPGLRCFGDELIGAGGVGAIDPTKLLIGVGGLSVNGYEAQSWLASRLGIEAEFAAQRHLVFSVTLADSREAVEDLVHGLEALAAEFSVREARPEPAPQWPPAPKVAVPLSQASFAASRRVALSEAAGEVCAETIIPYPPGVPLLLPGEEIDQVTLDFLQAGLSAGARVVGTADPTLTTVAVIAGIHPTRSGAIREVATA